MFVLRCSFDQSRPHWQLRVGDAMTLRAGPARASLHREHNPACGPHLRLRRRRAHVGQPAGQQPGRGVRRRRGCRRRPARRGRLAVAQHPRGHGVQHLQRALSVVPGAILHASMIAVDGKRCMLGATALRSAVATCLQVQAGCLAAEDARMLAATLQCGHSMASPLPWPNGSQAAGVAAARGRPRALPAAAPRGALAGRERALTGAVARTRAPQHVGLARQAS